MENQLGTLFDHNFQSNNSSTAFHKQAAALLDGEKPDECCMPVVPGVLVASWLLCWDCWEQTAVSHYTPLYTVTATVLGCCFLSAGSLATGQDTHNRSGKVITTQTFATCCLLLTGKWIIMTDIRQQRQVLRKCGGGSLRGSVRKESKGMETRKSETHAACCNNMQYITWPGTLPTNI